MPVTVVFLWASATEANSLQTLYSRLSNLPPPFVQNIRTPQKHILSYRSFRPTIADPSVQDNSIHHLSLPHHQSDPSAQFWIHDEASLPLTVAELGLSFTDILNKMDTGWQERQGIVFNLEGRGFEWGRDWRIWCGNLKQANRYRGVVVELQYLPATSLPLTKTLLTQFAEQFVFRAGEDIYSFWGRRIYSSTLLPAGKDEIEFEEWHTAIQYIELIQSLVSGRRRSSVVE